MVQVDVSRGGRRLSPLEGVRRFLILCLRPSKTIMTVHPGASNATVFLARNPMPDAMVAQAIPSVSPARAAEYFHKTECFCFDQQPLDGRASAEMPLQFIIDRDLPKDISTITLSYTIFDVTAMARGSVAAR